MTGAHAEKSSENGGYAPLQPSCWVPAAVCMSNVYEQCIHDQDKALEFYTEMLGFVKKNDVAAGEYRWLTVVSPDDQNGTKLLLD